MPVTKVFRTSHGDIAVSETSGKGLPLVLLHGNSSCKEVFRSLTDGPLGKAHRLIAVDLPGHGASSDASDPERTYTMPGYAEAVSELLAVMDVPRAAVFGWSLGGHVALEMLPRYAGMVGLMLSGTPPVGQGAEKVVAGFKPSPHVGLVGKPELTEEEAAILLGATYGASLTPELGEAAVRADGRARAIMFAALLEGRISDQRMLAETTPLPIAIVNGADDMLVNLDYVAGVAYRNLWDRHCYVLRGAAHAPFLQAPESFSAILTRFASEMDKRAGRDPAGAKVAAA
jgi:pimeloyl-ACP methyl ester carboxylesterase